MRKVAVITGGASGIGKAVADQLARESWNVIIGDISFPQHGAVTDVSGIYRQGVDVRSNESVEHFFNTIRTKFSNIDLLVNAAGLVSICPLLDIQPNQIEDVISSNLLGTIFCCRAVLPLMKSGRIVNIGSLVDRVALVENAVYGASKAAVRAFTEALNLELAATGVNLTLISPGATNTSAWNHIKKAPLDRTVMLQPADVARLVSDIASQPAGIHIEEVRVMPALGIL